MRTNSSSSRSIACSACLWRQYLAELEAKKSKRGPSAASKPIKVEFAKPSSSTPQPPQPPAEPEPKKAPDADLVDVFEPINQKQTPIVAQSQQQLQPQPQPHTQIPWGAAPSQPQQLSQAQTGFVSQPTGFPATVPFQKQGPARILSTPAYPSTGAAGLSRRQLQTALRPAAPATA